LACPSPSERTQEGQWEQGAVHGLLFTFNYIESQGRYTKALDQVSKDCPK
jgi:hypothetical protein